MRDIRLPSDVHLCVAYSQGYGIMPSVYTFAFVTFYIIPLGFPKLIGAIDCTHVPITGPLGEHEADFVNRKSTHSINVQVK